MSPYTSVPNALVLGVAWKQNCKDVWIVGSWHLPPALTCDETENAALHCT